MRIERYIKHWRNESTINPITWSLRKKHKGIEIEIGLAYNETESEIDPEHCFLVVLEDIGDKSVTIRNQERVLGIYHEMVHTVLRPLTKSDYLYPQARFLLNKAQITEDNIDQLLQQSFK